MRTARAQAGQLLDGGPVDPREEAEQAGHRSEGDVDEGCGAFDPAGCVRAITNVAEAVHGRLLGGMSSIRCVAVIFPKSLLPLRPNDTARLTAVRIPATRASAR
jgi:hypothetical protein